MPKVTTLRPHGNAYGDTYAKAVGDAYYHPSPEVLIEEGIVAHEGADDRISGAGPGARRTAKGGSA